MGFGRREASPASPLAVLGRGQLRGELGELGSRRRCPASDGAAYGGIERRGDARIRVLGGEREVPRSLFLLADGRGEPPMRGPAPPRRRLLVAHGGEQRMGEPDARVLDLEDPGARSPFERVGDLLAVAVGRREHRHGRPGECRRCQEDLAGLGGQSIKTLAEELPQRAGDPERLTRGASRGRQVAAKLEREEGVSTRHVAQLHELRSGQLEPESVPKQLEERAEAERTDKESLDRTLREPAIDLDQNVARGPGPSGREEADRLAA